MTVFEQITNLRAKKSDLVKTVDSITDAASIRAIKDQLVDINGQLSDLEILRDELAKSADTPDDSSKKKDAPSKDLKECLASNEYMNAFFDAFKSRQTLESAKNNEKYHVLLNALTQAGGTPAGSEGGFLLPTDFDDRIRELRRLYVSLIDLVTIEDVSSYSGWRSRVLNAATSKFAVTADMVALTDAAAPQYKRIDYTIKSYGGLIRVSNDLLSDTPVNIMNHLASWLATMSINTENAAIIALLSPLTVTPWLKTALEGPIKTALNKTLPPAISSRAILLTNQSGFDELDQMKDTTGRGLMQPNPLDETMMRYKGRRIVAMDDWALPNNAAKIPVYAGDLTEYIGFFRRAGFELDSTNVGAGSFETRTTTVSGVERFDVQVFDEKAAVHLEIA